MRIQITFLFLLVGLYASTQTPPQGISYQAVARTPGGGILADSTFFVKVSILANGANGTLNWEEEHEVTTSEFGLFTLVIGQGESTGNGSSPTFDLINWSAATYFLQIEIDPGDGIYEWIGTSQLLSVPYAFYAENAGDVDDADADPSNELITSVAVVNDSLVITDAGNEFIIDIGEIAEASSSDECITAAQLQGTDLNILQCGEAWIVPLESLIDDGDWTVDGGVMYTATDSIGIGTSSPTSTLDIKGSVAFEVSTVFGPVNVLMDEDTHVLICDVSNGDVTVNLPDASNCIGRNYTFKIFSTGLPNDFYVTTVGTQTVDNIDDPQFISLDSVSFSIISDGSNWWIINGNIAP